MEHALCQAVALCHLGSLPVIRRGNGGRGVVGNTNNGGNDGNMRIVQAKVDEEPVSVRVYNTVGALVHKSVQSFESQAAFMNLVSLAPGAYYVVLRDAKGETFTLPFVKK